MAAGPAGAGPAGAGLAWAGPGLKQQALDLLIRANLVHRELRDHDRSGSVIEVLRPLPPLAFIPLFIIWLGIGEAPKEVLIMIGVIPIMAVTTVAALDEVPGDLRLCARTLGASPRCTLLRMQIRSALPGILTGMRISMAGAWTSIVAAELIAATTGLWYLIMQAGDYLNTAWCSPASSRSRSWG